MVQLWRGWLCGAVEGGVMSITLPPDHRQLGLELARTFPNDGANVAINVAHTSHAPEHLGHARDLAMRTVPERMAVLVTDDDVCPLHGFEGGRRAPDAPPDAIRAVRLVSVLGQRWCDWAYYREGRSFNQPYDQQEKGTYITAAAQLVGSLVRDRVSYAECGGFRVGQDVQFCYRAVALGFRLLPPVPGTLELLHMDRLPPHWSDPDRLHRAFGGAL